MKKTTLAAGLIALAGLGSVGCKTTPKLAFWKADKAAGDTTVAHGPPTLPSDAAKLAASGQPTSAAQIAGGEAAPFVPTRVTKATTASMAATAMPASYPSTDAPAFTPDVASRVVSASASTPRTTGMSATTGNLGSISATPYDPTRPPRATTATTSPAATTPAASRYGGVASTGLPNTIPSAPTYGTPLAGAATGSTSSPVGGLPPMASYISSGSRYGGGATAPAPTTPGTTALPTYNDTPADIDAASRYGLTTPEAADAAISGVAAGATATASAVATTKPYRPGGTSSYPPAAVTRPVAEVAMLQQESATTTTTTPNVPGATLPPVARPGEATPTPGATTMPGTAGATSPIGYR